MDGEQDETVGEPEPGPQWTCLHPSCGKKHVGVATACPDCGWKRPGITVSAIRFTFVVPSRDNPPGNPHILKVHEDRFVECTSCPAATFQKQCWAAKAWQRRFRGQKDRQPMDLVPRKIRALTILILFKDAGVRDDDNLLEFHYIQYWHRDVPLNMTWPDFLAWKSTLGFDLRESIRRRRAGIQNDDKLAPASPEVALDRAAKGHIRAPAVNA